MASALGLDEKMDKVVPDFFSAGLEAGIIVGGSHAGSLFLFEQLVNPLTDRMDAHIGTLGKNANAAAVGWVFLNVKNPQTVGGKNPLHRCE